MKPTRRFIVLTLAVLFVGGGAFLVTRVTAQSPGNRPGQRERMHDRLGRWLGMESQQMEQLGQADPDFHQDMRRLGREVEIEQLKLATLVESDDATDAEIRTQFTTLGEAHLAINNRVGEHVLALRPHLDVEQRAKLFGMLGSHLRGGRGGPHHQAGPGGPGMRGGPPFGAPRDGMHDAPRRGREDSDRPRGPRSEDSERRGRGGGRGQGPRADTLTEP